MLKVCARILLAVLAVTGVVGYVAAQGFPENPRPDFDPEPQSLTGGCVYIGGGDMDCMSASSGSCDSCGLDNRF